MTNVKGWIAGVVALIGAYAGLHMLNRGTDTTQTPSPGAPRPPSDTFGPPSPTSKEIMEWTAAFRRDKGECSRGYSRITVMAQVAMVPGWTTGELIDEAWIPCLEEKGWSISYDYTDVMQIRHYVGALNPF